MSSSSSRRRGRAEADETARTAILAQDEPSCSAAVPEYRTSSSGRYSPRASGQLFRALSAGLASLKERLNAPLAPHYSALDQNYLMGGAMEVLACESAFPVTVTVASGGVGAGCPAASTPCALPRAAPLRCRDEVCARRTSYGHEDEDSCGSDASPSSYGRSSTFSAPYEPLDVLDSPGAGHGFRLKLSRRPQPPTVSSNHRSTANHQPLSDAAACSLSTGGAAGLLKSPSRSDDDLAAAAAAATAASLGGLAGGFLSPAPSMAAPPVAKAAAGRVLRKVFSEPRERAEGTLLWGKEKAE
ncbi:hypothetical protein HYH03_001935 [Edaphochlamys debaryana]|uniref:Uncharacterized protein n=1 Tax=Edaphochlamys debaryana TaxID=47281 RepID=A0A835YG84_9CHLO|nr:hypothetical protein HYH03_001935 [Edaphochlamys debaryana]|eukprot:KAG2500361.1 hypothetical protein HYH03_001935 [Edaphochlamys debaryana]